MTWRKRLILVQMLVGALAVTAMAQDMTKDEWQRQVQELTAKRDNLQSKLRSLQGEVDNLRRQDTEKAAALQKCEDELLALVGANQQSIAAHDDLLKKLAGKLEELARLSDQELWNRKKELEDLQKELDAAKKNKISALPSYHDQFSQLQARVDAMRKSSESLTITYTVGSWSKDRECLWNIAKKPSIYNNALLWPKIWQGNRDQIRDADLIRPGQKLKVPPRAELTEAEKSAARRYWLGKQTAAAVPMNP